MNNLALNLIPLLGQVITIPTQLATVIKYTVYAILLISFVWGVAKVVKGASSIERGEEGKMTIAAGVLIACAPFMVVGAFSAVGLWANMGITFP